MTPPDANHPSSLTLTRTIAVIVALTAYNQFSSMVSDRLNVGDTDFGNPWKLPLTALGLVVSVALVWLGIVRWQKTSLRDLGWATPVSARLVGAGVLLGAALCGLVVGVYAVFGGRQALRELAHALATYSVAERVFFVYIGLKWAFVEESLFRGALIAVLSRRVGAVVAVVASGVAFGLYHRSLTPIPLAMKCIMGVLLGLVTVRTRSLWPSAIAHAIVWSVMGTS